MTDEILKQLSQAIQDSDQTINSPDSSVVLVSQKLKSILELIPHTTETNQSDISTDNLR
jgi:hypothetical protein